MKTMAGSTKWTLSGGGGTHVRAPFSCNTTFATLSFSNAVLSKHFRFVWFTIVLLVCPVGCGYVQVVDVQT